MNNSYTGSIPRHLLENAPPTSQCDVVCTSGGRTSRATCYRALARLWIFQITAAPEASSFRTVRTLDCPRTHEKSGPNLVPDKATSVCEIRFVGFFSRTFFFRRLQTGLLETNSFRNGNSCGEGGHVGIGCLYIDTKAATTRHDPQPYAIDSRLTDDGAARETCGEAPADYRDPDRRRRTVADLR